MIAKRAFLSVAFTFLLFSHLFAQDNNRAMLRARLTAEIEKIAGNFDGVMGVAIKDLTTGEERSFSATTRRQIC
jgi:hypothetical protein